MVNFSLTPNSFSVNKTAEKDLTLIDKIDIIIVKQFIFSILLQGKETSYEKDRFVRNRHMRRLPTSERGSFGE